MASKKRGTGSFIFGLIAGLAVSVPVAIWRSPRSGPETREAIRQQGVLLTRRAGETVLKPIEQLRGDSVADALEEGRAIAAGKQAARSEE